MILNAGHEGVYTVGGQKARLRVRLESRFTVFSEDCFGGRLDSAKGHPREVAPYPFVNPLAGPIHVDGVGAGDTIALHICGLEPAREWGVATISPDFGLLSSTRGSPTLQDPQAEHVWIWRVSGDELVTDTAQGRQLRAPLDPFLGTLGVAPAHGHVVPSVALGDYGGNLDLPMLTTGATLYLTSHVDGAHVHIGDGHYVQGDGEIAGTAVEGAMNTTLVAGRIDAPLDGALDWPRIETDAEIGVIGVGRPMENAMRVAAAGLVRWVANLCDLPLADAHQLVSQCGRFRVGNLVNPEYSVTCILPKRWLPGAPEAMGGMHRRLRSV